MQPSAASLRICHAAAAAGPSGGGGSSSSPPELPPPAHRAANDAPAVTTAAAAAAELGRADGTGGGGVAAALESLRYPAEQQAAASATQTALLQRLAAAAERQAAAMEARPGSAAAQRPRQAGRPHLPSTRLLLLLCLSSSPASSPAVLHAASGFTTAEARELLAAALQGRAYVLPRRCEYQLPELLDALQALAGVRPGVEAREAPGRAGERECLVSFPRLPLPAAATATVPSRASRTAAAGPSGGSAPSPSAPAELPHLAPAGAATGGPAPGGGGGGVAAALESLRALAEQQAAASAAQTALLRQLAAAQERQAAAMEGLAAAQAALVGIAREQGAAAERHFRARLLQSALTRLDKVTSAPVDGVHKLLEAALPLGGAHVMHLDDGHTEPAAAKESVADGSAIVNAPPAQRYPAEPPSFTLGDIRRAIPAHCFERSTLKSSMHLAFDVLVCSVLWFASTFIDKLPVPGWVSYGILWPLYWFWQGAFMTGIWVIAHECGHGAFSPSDAVNDGVGLVFHSLLLVPYYSWKHSHRRHHQHTGSTELDEVFVPEVRPPGSKAHWIQRTPVYRLGHLLFQQLLGWPLYLAFNVSGHAYPRWANHFDPYSPIFTKKERIEVLISDLSLVAVVAGLAAVGKAFGWIWLLKTYGIPYLIVNHWLVMITFLQHTHPNLPHYGEGEWDWLRGAMATVDRSYGILNKVFHNITDTHVAHHLFSYMPHYHAMEATQHIKKVLGPYYATDERNCFAALWQELGACAFVTPDAGGPEKVYWYSK
ncbi:hypothetical protein HYH03_002813 [Edaphochlamys debaryana]|uniref:Fatty acid desaturase domain-containing protein n=1 Tax=Edaphochlamys debaryana TaxID=47281 RepID=A0A835YK98_9CHLO|nr:hypothetical protein HYH03_002813 [Edaphochlamys debaryana]|eukprot:KAG2499234.1 hypothetical protein HYH03_002813 [Edaphochlamys debaryana]